MVNLKRIIIGVVWLLATFGIGTLGYMVVEGWSLFDGLYMTVITLTTVGYGEVRPLSQPGRTFTILLIFLGVGFMFYVATAIAQAVVEGQLQDVFGRRRLEKKIRNLKDHFIICGFGRIGEVIARELSHNNIPIVMVDNRPQHTPFLERSGYLHVIGNATQEEVLLAAGIEQARGLISVVSSDADNVYIVLTARSMKPDLNIVARAGETGSQQKLRRAGANVVISPYELGGQRMAQTILRPTVVDFMDVAFGEAIDLSLEEIPVGSSGDIIGQPLKESGLRQRLDLIIVAIKRLDGSMLFNPQSDTRILQGDTLIALGSKANLDKLMRILAA
ncbi:MAG: potassium channel protein [Deltaproteobacteria bacterium]|nr:potassium channel protein [Deltaproteobacteria bacterium]